MKKLITLISLSFVLASCSGDDGTNLYSTCPIHQEVNPNGICVDLDLATLSFTVTDATVETPRPGEAREGRRLVISGAIVIIQEFIPGRATPISQQYTTTEIGKPSIQVTPNVAVQLDISKEGYLPKTVYISAFGPGEIADLYYDLYPTWVYDSEGPPDPDAPIEVTVIVETLDFNGDIQVDQVVINDPIFNLSADTVEVLSNQAVQLTGDVNINGVTIQDPLIFTDGTVQVDVSGAVTMQGSDILVFGSGNTDMQLLGDATLEIDAINVTVNP